MKSMVIGLPSMVACYMMLAQQEGSGVCHLNCLGRGLEQLL